MLSPADRRFVNYWKDQREGSKTEYYVQYTIAWSVVGFLSLFFLTKLIMERRDMGGWISFFIILPVSIIGSLIVTHINYRNSERRYKRLTSPA